MSSHSPLTAPACLAAVALACAGCGGFSSGDSPGLEPPKPPEFAKPENQGRVEGRIVVASGFLRSLATDLRDALEASAGGLEGSPVEASAATSGALLFSVPGGSGRGPASGADVLSAMRVRLEGSRRNRAAEVSGDGSFVVEKLPAGEYRLEVALASERIAAFRIPVEVQQTTQVLVRILGRDHADLDEDGTREDLAVRIEVRAGPGKAKPARVLMPDGSVRALLPDGGREYLLPGGVVRREQPDGTAVFRRDHDLDGVADPDDPDYRRLRPKPTPVPDDALLLGTAFPPLIREAGVRAPHSPTPPEDLALFTADLAEEVGGDPYKVAATLYSAEGPEFTFELRDDGGEADLLPEWPGHQPSGDEVAGDGLYSYLVPVDATTRPLIYNRQVVVEAVDSEGRRSNRFTFFPYHPSPQVETSAAAARSPSPWDAVRSVEFRGRRRSGRLEVSARFRVAPSMAGVVATLLGPGGFRRVFAPGAGSGPDGWIPFETRPAPFTGDGTYYIVLGVPDGDVFFAGRVLDEQTSFLARTGG